MILNLEHVSAFHIEKDGVHVRISFTDRSAPVTLGFEGGAAALSFYRRILAQVSLNKSYESYKI